VDEVRKAHVTHGKYDINDRTAWWWQDHSRRTTHGIFVQKALHRREAIPRGAPSACHPIRRNATNECRRQAADFFCVFKAGQIARMIAVSIDRLFFLLL
jgi:hypothetical protein